MKKILSALLLLFCLSSCDDGDLIVTTFNFDDAILQDCGGPGGYLLYKINEGDVESISLRLGTPDQLFTTSNTRTFTLNGDSNFVTYRIFSSEVTSAYFCNEVPPTTPQVTTEYFAGSGTATMITTSIFDDNDGIPMEDELDTLNADGDDNPFTNPLDTDNDGIPNYYDKDDDGDNVLTIDEIDMENADGDNDPLTNPLNTDAGIDEIPDYLDQDDDGDGVATRYEANGSLDPTQYNTSAGEVPNYLNNQISLRIVVDQFREHSYTFDSDISLVLNDLVLISGEEQITRETLNMGIIESILTDTTVLTPSFPTN